MPMIEWENEYPSTAEYADFYSGYVELVNTSNIINALKSQMHEVYTLVHFYLLKKEILLMMLVNGLSKKSLGIL